MYANVKKKKKSCDMASFFTFLEHSLYVCTSRLVGLIFSVLAAVLTQINTDALTVWGFLWVICSARRPLAWPQRFSCHSGTERHLIPRHERIRSVLSTSVGKVLLFPFYFLLCQYVFWSTRRWKIQQLCCSVWWDWHVKLANPIANQWSPKRHFISG